MDPAERNRREWEKPDNWRGPAWTAFYVGERDTRLFVPKRIPWMGLTINLGHPRGPLLMFGACALAVLIVTGTLVLVAWTG